MYEYVVVRIYIMIDTCQFSPFYFSMLHHQLPLLRSKTTTGLKNFRIFRRLRLYNFSRQICRNFCRFSCFSFILGVH